MAKLGRAQSVLRFEGQVEEGGKFYARYASRYDPEEGEEGQPLSRLALLEVEDWEDMDRPDEVTMTLVPGDQLNEPVDSEEPSDEQGG